MEVGDKVQVDIAGHKVADATVKSIENGQATLIVPGTVVVMAVRTSLAPEVEVPKESAEHTEHVLLTDEAAHVELPNPEIVETPPVTPEAAATSQTLDPNPVVSQENPEPGNIAPVPVAVEQAVEEKATEGGVS